MVSLEADALVLNPKQRFLQAWDLPDHCQELLPEKERSQSSLSRNMIRRVDFI